MRSPERYSQENIKIDIFTLRRFSGTGPGMVAKHDNRPQESSKKIPNSVAVLVSCPIRRYPRRKATLCARLHPPHPVAVCFDCGGSNAYKIVHANCYSTPSTARTKKTAVFRLYLRVLKPCRRQAYVIFGRLVICRRGKGLCCSCMETAAVVDYRIFPVLPLLP